MAERRRTMLRDQHRHEKQRQQLRVSAVRQLNELFMRVEFDYGDAGFESHGFDDVVVLHFPVRDSSSSFRMLGGQPEENIVSREYTVRHVDRQRRLLTVDFLLHGEGIATQWARQVAPGQVLWCIFPRMCKGFPEAQRTHIFADPCALPAVQRFHAEAGSTPGQTVLVGLPTDFESHNLVGRRKVWMFEPGFQVVQVTGIFQAGPTPDTFYWIAGEAGWVGGLRRVLVEQFGVNKENIQFTGYWRAS